MSSIFDRVANQVASGALAKVRIPDKVMKHLPLARALMRGDVNAVLNAGVDAVTGRVFDRSALLGGISMQEARAIFDQCVATDYAKKNLWHINISNLAGSNPYNFNLFATDVGYAPYTVSGDAVYIGSGSFDNITGTERVEMRVTTLDDANGSMKAWFQERMAQLAKVDGTFGLPIDYLFRVDVMHAFIGEQADGAGGAFVDTFLMRPGNIEYDLSRRDDNLQELQMSFVQFDTFAALT